MPLWASAVILIVCIGGAAIFRKRYGQSQQTGFFVLTVAITLLSLVFLAYTILTLLLLAGIR